MNERMRGRVSITITLATAIGLLVLVTAGSVLGVGVWLAQKNTFSLLSTNADQAIGAAVNQIEQHLRPAEHRAAFIARRIEQDHMDPAELDALQHGHAGDRFGYRKHRKDTVFGERRAVRPVAIADRLAKHHFAADRGDGHRTVVKTALDIALDRLLQLAHRPCSHGCAGAAIKPIARPENAQLFLLLSAPFRNCVTRRIAFPVSSAGGDAKAMWVHRRAFPTP